MKAVVVLSGGQDSTTCLFYAIKKYGRQNVCAIGFNYGQRHVSELNIADMVCKEQGVSYKIVKINTLSQLTDNYLTNKNTKDIKALDSGIPNTFVEGRNMVFLTYAGIYAKSRGADVLITGVSEADFSGYPDCREAFVRSLERTLSLAMDYNFTIETPLMRLNKAQIWHLAAALDCLNTIKNKTLTCYNGIAGDGCKECPACKLRARGYALFCKDEASKRDVQDFLTQTK